MPYQVLARKYRPLRFSDVVGQDHVTRTLQNALEQGRIAHGYIFSGHRGIGKTTIARILASALNCQRTIGSPARPTPEPCLTCDSCLEIRQGNAVDVIEIDAATNRGIDEIRELRDAARYRPSRDRFKIYILDEAHQITDAAFNALLKTLEEPPDHIVFMMATTEPENIPQTIRSRCQHFSFHAVKLDDILGQLQKIALDENVLADPAALDLLAEAGDGSMRDALSIMDQAIASAPTVDGKPQLSAQEIRDLMGSVPNTVFEEILEYVARNEAAGVLTTASRLLDAGNSPAQIARQFVRYLRNCVVASIAGLTPDSADTELLQISPDERRRAARSATLFTEEELTRFMQVMLRTFDDLGFRQEQRFHLELGMLKLVHLQRLLPMEQFLSQLPRPTTPQPPRILPPRREAMAQTSAQKPKLPSSRLDSSPPPQIVATDTPRNLSPHPALSEPPHTSTTDGTKKLSFRPESSQLHREDVVEKPAPSPATAIPNATSEAQSSLLHGSSTPSSASLQAAEGTPTTPDETVAHLPVLGDGSSTASSVSIQAVEDAPTTPAASQPQATQDEARAARIAAMQQTGTASAHAVASKPPQTPFPPIAISSPFSQQPAEEPSNVPALTQPNALTAADPSTGLNFHLDQPAAPALPHLAPPQHPSLPDADPESTNPDSAIEAAPPTPASQETADLQAFAIEALFAVKTHNSAAEQLEETTWTIAGGELRIQTSLSKQMLATIFRPDVEAILKGALRNKGVNGLKLVFLPGTRESKPSTPKKPRTGSAQAKALEHPTVQAAQRLFNAEVTNVFDLRRD